MNQSNRAIPIALTLYPDDLDLLDRIGEEHGLRSRSAVARYIFNDWPRLKLAVIATAVPQGDCSAQGGCACLPELNLAVSGAYDEPLATGHA